MFDDGGVPNPEHFHQFMASPRAAALSLPLSFAPFDSLYATTTTQHLLHHPVVPPVQHQDQPSDHHHDHLMIPHHHPKIDLEGPIGMDRSSSLPDPHRRQLLGNYGRHLHHQPWTSEEVLALLRIRSGLESWLPDFTWDHVSRKMEEIGFKRSGDECKERFEEEESKYLINGNSAHISTDYVKNSNFRVFSELDELYDHHHEHHHDQARDDDHLHHHDESPKDLVTVPAEDDSKKKTILIEDPTSQEDDKMSQTQSLEHINFSMEHEDKSEKAENEERSSSSSSRRDHKRRRRKREKFEVLKGFCEEMVKKMIAQQEEIHRKLIEDMLRRDEESVTREEAWKKQEMERIDKELEIRAQEQAMVSERSASIMKFINKLTSLEPTTDGQLQHHNYHQELVNQVQRYGTTTTSATTANAAAATATAATSTPSSSSSIIVVQNPTAISASIQDRQIPIFAIDQNPSLNANKPISSSQQPSQNPTLLTIQANTLPAGSVSPRKPRTHIPEPSSGHDKVQDVGKRWPKDEVLALINIRCKLYNNGGGADHNHLQDQNKEGSTTKAPLWERVSQGMLALGYKRSAKRCKEKWENINKYFRKTKDSSKRRSIDSRTCPYFHQLSSLYTQGKLPASESPAADTGPTGGSVVDSIAYASSVGDEKKSSEAQVQDFGFGF